MKRDLTIAVTVLAFVLSARVARAEPSPVGVTDRAPEDAPRTDAPGTRVPSDINVRVSSEFAGYADTDHVFVASPTVAGHVTNPIAGWSFGGRYLVDVVSAASVDIVSTASRRWEEVRHVGSADAAYKPGNFGAAVNANVSSEPDYLSLTAGGALTQDILNKNVTLMLAYSHGHDIGGRSGTPFSVFSRTLDINSFKAGATFVLDNSTIVSVVSDAIVESGDPSKPYRYVPLFAPGANVPKGASTDLVNQLRVSARPLEQLPLSRDRFALSGRLAHRFSGSTIRADERMYVDTWGLKASTADARFLIDLSERVEVGPHVRFHIQSPVTFWQRAYTLQSGFDVPALRTGDRELGPLLSLTAGGTFRLGIGGAGHPKSSSVGVDANVATTHYLDNLYISQRTSLMSALLWETEL